MTSPPWTLSPADNPEPLPAQVDVLILGAEISAFACAYQLALGGAKVLILDPFCRGSDPGSSLRAAGILVPGLPEPAHRLVNALGLEDCQKLFHLTRRSIQRLKELNCFKSTGVVMASLSPEEAEALATDVSVYNTLGWKVDIHSPKAHLADKGIGPGLCLPEAGTIVPGDAFRQLEVDALQAGAKIHYQCPVNGIEDNDDGVSIHTPGLTIQTELVLHCTGWDLVHSLPWAIEKLFPVRLQHLCQSKPNTLVEQPLILQYGHSWVRSVGTDTLLSGGCRWATPHLEVGETDQVQLSVAVKKRIIARSQALFDVPIHATVHQHWGQITTHTCDGLPFVGPLPGSARQMVCTGWNGRPWAMAIALGELVAAGILDGDTQAIPDCLASYRMI